ncbi:transposase [Photorhabdus australis]|uniref:transposase n=1 Tax=Photorhabdus australis TaxID=286156 RepID=UPI0005696FD2
MKRSFSPEFKLESAQLVLDQNDNIAEAATLHVHFGTIDAVRGVNLIKFSLNYYNRDDNP